MPVTLNFTEDQALGVYRSFILSILPAGVEVVKGQDNRVPEPSGADFVVFWPITRERTETNVDVFDPVAQTTSYAQPVLLTVQTDVHGPNAADNAQILTTLYRDDFAVQFFQASPYDVGPIHADDPKQVPFLNSESQWERRWIVEAVMQLNQIVTIPTQSAIVLEVNLVEADLLP